MTSSPDVVVVGGGLVGAACAYELARDGHRVVVVDRHDAGRATDAGAGILSPQTMGGMPASFLDLADLAGAHYRALIPALADVGAPDPRYAVCGALRIAFREMEDEAFAVNARESLARHPDALRAVAPGEAQARFPPLAEAAPRCSTSAARESTAAPWLPRSEFAARVEGVDWRHGSVEKISVEGDRATSVECEDGPFRAARW